MWKLLGGLLLLLVEPILARILGALGFGLVSYTGLGFVMEQIEAAISTQVGSLASDIVGILGLLGFGQVLTLTLSAMMVRAFLSGMNSAGSVVRSSLGNKTGS